MPIHSLFANLHPYPGLMTTTTARHSGHFKKSVWENSKKVVGEKKKKKKKTAGLSGNPTLYYLQLTLVSGGLAERAFVVSTPVVVVAGESQCDAGPSRRTDMGHAGAVLCLTPARAQALMRLARLPARAALAAIAKTKTPAIMWDRRVPSDTPSRAGSSSGFPPAWLAVSVPRKITDVYSHRPFFLVGLRSLQARPDARS